MAISVGMHEAKTTLSRLVEAALGGEEVVITRRGHPVARIEPVRPAKARTSLFGSLKGQIKMSDDFDDLPENVLRDFEG
ncbi:MAG: type II toxin-antitoxin system Phd/YefM family antitoxin [Solirubrobacterales bacterium]